MSPIVQIDVSTLTASILEGAPRFLYHASRSKLRTGHLTNRDIENGRTHVEETKTVEDKTSDHDIQILSRLMTNLPIKTTFS